MKKMMIVLTLTIALSASIAQAKTNCSRKGVSGKNSVVAVVVDEHSPKATVTVTVIGEDGRPVCGEEVNLSTSRNQPKSGWPAGVDKINPQGKLGIKDSNTSYTDENGKATFVLTTKMPAGTTVYAFAGEGEQLGNRDGLPFSYSPIKKVKKAKKK